jgi:hypothetical protein
MMEVARTSGAPVNFYQTTQHYNPHNSHLNNHHHKNMKSHQKRQWSETSVMEEQLKLHVTMFCNGRTVKITCGNV